MNKATLLKFAQFLLIMIVGVAADQWTKWYAEERLASSRLDHPIVLTVPEEMADKTVKEFLTSEFTYSSPKEIETLTRRWVRDSDGRRMRAEDKVSAKQEVRVTNREVVIVKDYWDFQYTRNPGAAFGFLASSDSQWRRPFFIVISCVAVLIILYILYGVTLAQQLLIWGLSLIAAGAMRNFIDRIRFNYVIDFILWKYTDAHRWPTFNVADALICVGVGFMLIEIMRDTMRERREIQEQREALAEESEGEDEEMQGA